jgi:hypothetical protein
MWDFFYREFFYKISSLLKQAMKAVTKDIIFVRRVGMLRKIVSLRKSLNVTIANDGDI